jgi:hypothetical protein
MSLTDLDGRKRTVRRAKALVRHFSKALGGRPAPHQMISVNSAAEMTAVAEQVRARYLAGDAGVSLDDVVRAQGAMNRAIRELCLPDTSSEEDDEPIVLVISADDAKL